MPATLPAPLGGGSILLLSLSLSFLLCQPPDLGVALCVYPTLATAGPKASRHGEGVPFFFLDLCVAWPSCMSPGCPVPAARSIVYSPPSWPRRPTCLWPAWGRRPDGPLHPWRWAKSCGRWVLARASGPSVRVTAGRQQVEWPRAHPGSVGVTAPGEVPLEAGPRGCCCGPRRLARGSGRGRG